MLTIRVLFNVPFEGQHNRCFNRSTDTTGSVRRLEAGREPGPRVAPRRDAPRKTIETGAGETGRGAETAEGPDPETEKEPGLCCLFIRDASRGEAQTYDQMLLNSLLCKGF